MTDIKCHGDRSVQLLLNKDTHCDIVSFSNCLGSLIFKEDGCSCDTDRNEMESYFTHTYKTLKNMLHQHVIMIIHCM